MPHHRRHHLEHADKYPVESLDHMRPPNTRYQVRNHNLSLRKLNQVLGPPNDHDVVESWLGGVAAHASHPWPRSPGLREEEVKCPRRQLPRDATPRNRKSSEHVDPAWRPNHILPIGVSHSYSQQQQLSYGRNLKRPRHRGNDSSLISGFSNSTKPSECSLVSALREHGHISPGIPLGEEDRSAAGDSSPVSRLDELAAFERRPRRKTREDKYDTKKQGDHKHETTREKRQHNHRRKKTKRSEKKRKSAMPSKNVMNSFNSHAVLHDRITVQPNFKPGLFENGRRSKGQPVPDLAFSDMQFLKHQKREPQSKPLSRSRLRDRQRKNREIEQVSSFFLPPNIERNLKGAIIPTWEDDRNAMNASIRHGRDLVIHSRHQNLELSPSPHSPTTMHHEWSSSSQDRICQRPTHKFTDLERRQESSKATTYFTWSSSHQSPQLLERDIGMGSFSSNSTRTVTPKPIRKALIATGVYQDTGIYPYDNYTNKQKEDTTNERNPSLVSSHDRGQQESSVPPTTDSQAEVIMTDDSLKALEQRWNVILPPEWRPERDAASRDVLETEEHQAHDPLEEKGPRFLRNSEPVDRQDIAGVVRIEPSKTNTQNHSSKSSTIQVAGTGPNNNSENTVSTPVKLGQNECDQTPGSQGCTSQTSREAMPPPPLPTHRNSATGGNIISNIECALSFTGSCATVDGTEDTTRVSLRNASVHTDLDDDCNASTSSLRPNTDTERINSSLEFTSWIPHTRTPSIVNDNRCKVLSRMSMRTPIYVSQLDKKPRTASTPTQPSKAQSTESISEFIARIEREAQEHISPEDYVPVSQETSMDKTTLGSPMAHIETQHQVIPIPTNLPEEPLQLSSSAQLGHEILELDHQLVEDHNIEDFTMEGRDMETPELTQSVTQPFENLDDECLEMSRFWRPNHFSQL